MSDRATLRGVVFALLAGVSWGFSGTLGQYLFTVKGVSASWLTVWRMVISGGVLLLLTAVRKPIALKRVWRSRRDAIQLIIFALCGLMAVQYAYMQAIHYSNAGTATAVQYLGEAFILIYACITGRRLPKLAETTALLLAMGGIFLLATHGDPLNMVLSGQGLFWGLTSALALMLYTLLPARLIAKYDSISITGYGLLIGGAALALLTRPWEQSVTLDAGLLAAMGGVILVGTVCSFTMYLQSAVDLGGVKAGLLASVETVSAPFFAIIWLHTRFEPMDYIGFVCIMIMVLLLAVPALRQELPCFHRRNKTKAV